MKISDSHEWIVLENERVGKIGITAFAQKELGEIVYIQPPILGQRLNRRQELAVLESTKAATDLYSPVSGTVIEVNHSLIEQPDLINHSPENEGWICKVELTHPEELESLMDRDNYLALFMPKE
jgi:glycine cleavage system H protein